MLCAETRGLSGCPLDPFGASLYTREVELVCGLKRKIKC